MNPPSVLGFDIGGANLKVANSDGVALSTPFALWKNPSQLPSALRGLSEKLPASDLWAVTMTGELCDCYATKREGVNEILDAVSAAAKNTPVLVWRNDGRLVDISTARATAHQVAAANWLALAQFVGRYACEGAALLVDIGSTTTDIVPLSDGVPVPTGRTDPERLRSRELVYTGVRRTPLCALLGAEGSAEFFATALDVYLVLGLTKEDAGDLDTADGRPATRAAAHARLSRMLCGDAETISEEETRRLSQRIFLQQVHLIEESIQAVMTRHASPLQTIVTAGSGEYLAKRVIDGMPELATARIVSLADKQSTGISTAACAYSVAVLAQEVQNGHPRQ